MGKIILALLILLALLMAMPSSLANALDYDTYKITAQGVKTTEKAGEFCAEQFDASIHELNEIIERLQVKIVRQTIHQDMTVIYGYSPKLRGGLHTAAGYVNIQIAVRGESVCIGTPLIAGWY